eukprot:TRINITY_DN101819_c0_g1_i1.p1 TRINITY_DN101819_c0_g1~~TRINITY_DN101819_c0_g1_i1.p1  ORF type:complete len:779 (+),score=150.40 TRINITY_DN101819_c0_g1_i1:145-2481(+)
MGAQVVAAAMSEGAGAPPTEPAALGSHGHSASDGAPIQAAAVIVLGHGGDVAVIGEPADASKSGEVIVPAAETPPAPESEAPAAEMPVFAGPIVVETENVGRGTANRQEEEGLAEQQDEKLSMMRNIVPQVSEDLLIQALLTAGGNIERAVNQLLDPARILSPPGVPSSAIVLDVCDDVVMTCTPTGGAHSSSLTAGHVAEDMHGRSETLLMLRSMFPDASDDQVRQALLDANWNADVAAQKLLAPPPPPPPPPPLGAYLADDPVPCVEEEDSQVQVQVQEVSAAEEAAHKIARILPDCCPDFIREKLEEVANYDQNAALERILAESYPKRQKTAPASSSTATAGPPRDDAYWFEPAKRDKVRQTKQYSDAALRLLGDEFSEFGKPSINLAFSQSGRLYAPAWKLCYEAQSDLLEGRPVRAPLIKLRCPRRPPRQRASVRELPSETLREEAQFVEQYREKCQEQKTREEAREKYRKECEWQGLLLECECCFIENIAEDTIPCPAGHLFCKDCVQRYVEGQMSGETGVPQLKCMSTSGCQEHLAPSELRRVLSTKLLDDFDKRLQKASIEKVLLGGVLAGLEKCPFCDFVMDMDLPPEENKIYVCQAIDCGKESCRLCKRESHIPYRCEEVETKTKEGHRLAVEEAMTDALVRDCPHCKSKGVSTRFVKEADCNKMTCPKCKNWMCYICGEAISKSQGYAHFCQHVTTPGKPCSKCTKCKLWAGSSKKDLEAMEAERVKAQGERADEEYKKRHADDQLHESLAVLEEAGKPQAKKQKKH